MKMDGLLFDLDGTLWDVVPRIQANLNDLLADHPEVTRREVGLEELYSYMGLRTPDIMKLCFPEEKQEKRDEIMQAYCSRLCPYIKQGGAKLFANVEDILKELRKEYKIFLVSNCDPGYIDTFTGLFHLETYFTGTICSGDTGKPKWDNIKTICDSFSLKSPIYIGDTRKDMEAANIAGVPFIHAAYGFDKACEARYKINDIKDLPEILKDIEEQTSGD